jgi:two-component system, OmpR family, response regulator
MEFSPSKLSDRLKAALMFTCQAGTVGTAGFQGPARVLVVDHEQPVLDLLAATLRLSGFDVQAVGDGARAMSAARTRTPDIVVLDVVLPDMDGFTLARRLRAVREGVPMLFLTGRDPVTDRIAGLTVGGDDYVTKPFSVEEVVLRLRAILRRRQLAADPDGGGHLHYADVTLDEDAHEVRRAGVIVELSPTEFNLLRYLMVNAERVVSKAQILDRVWSYDYGGDSRIVESYISYLRKKIDRTGDPLIHTVRGIGYTLRDHSDHRR